MNITNAQILALLSNLPAESLEAAVRGAPPQVSTEDARQVFKNIEEEGLISWENEGTGALDLTDKGRAFYGAMLSSHGPGEKR